MVEDKLTADQIIERFENRQRKPGGGYMCKCPAHDDKRNSLSVDVGNDGTVLLKCFAGCQTSDIIKAVGLELKDLFPANGVRQIVPAARLAGELTSKETAYIYRDATGQILYRVVRTPNKQFFQQSYDLETNQYYIGLNGVRWVPYNLPKLVNADPSIYAILCEGEKDVDRLSGFGLLATTNSGGAGKWRDEYNQYLKGRKVAIIPDNDQPGHNHADVVARSLHKSGIGCRIIVLPDLAEKGDVSDWLNNGGTIEQLKKLIADAPVYEPKEPVEVKTPNPNEFRPTQGYLSERFVSEHGENLHYCFLTGKWYIWDGRRWCDDDTGYVYELAKQTITGMYTEAANPKTMNRGELAKLTSKHDTDAGYRQIVSGAEYLPKIPIVQKQLDADPWLLNCLNGTLNLQTGELQSYRREDLITKLAPVEYRVEASHELWTRFLKEVTGRDNELAAFLQRCVGYSLTGLTGEEKLFFIHGVAATGKSTFIEAIKSTLGDYAVVADFETFLEKKYSGGPRNDIARLAGARTVVSVEVSDGCRMASGLVKLITGGDSVAARYLYHESFEFTPAFKLWLASNHAPLIDSEDSAMWRRIVHVPFEQVIPVENRDPQVKATLKNEPEAQRAILSWAVSGCLAWQSIGLKVPTCVETATSELRDNMDPLLDFLDEQCVFGPEYWAEAKKLRQVYLKYAEDVGIRRTLSPKAFSERLKNKGCIPERTMTERGWKGVGLVNP